MNNYSQTTFLFDKQVLKEQITDFTLSNEYVSSLFNLSFHPKENRGKEKSLTDKEAKDIKGKVEALRVSTQGTEYFEYLCP